jgi:hypothetical protein
MTGGRLVEHASPDFMIVARDGLPCYPAAAQESLPGTS